MIRMCYSAQFSEPECRKLKHLTLSPGLSIYSFCPQRLGVYGVSENALLGPTKTLTVGLAANIVRVNSRAPGAINTDFGQVVRTKGRKPFYPLSIE